MCVRFEFTSAPSSPMMFPQEADQNDQPVFHSIPVCSPATFQLAFSATLLPRDVGCKKPTQTPLKNLNMHGVIRRMQMTKKKAIQQDTLVWGQNIVMGDDSRWSHWKPLQRDGIRVPYVTMDGIPTCAVTHITITEAKQNRIKDM